MKKKIFTSAVVIAVFSLVGKIIGFLKSVMMASYFGSNIYTDAFYLSETIFTSSFSAIAVSIGVAFVPMYVKVKAAEDCNAAYTMVDRILKMVSGLSVILTVFVICVAPWLIQITAPSYSGEQLQMSVQFLRIMAIGIVFSLSINVLKNLLNAERAYASAYIVSIINSLTVVLFVFCGAEQYGIMAAVVAVSCSFLIQYLFLRLSSNKYILTSKAGWDSNDKILFQQALPIFLSNGIAELSQLINNALLVRISVGAVTAMNYAVNLFRVTTDLLTMPISTVIYTEFSDAYVKGDKNSISLLIERTVRCVLLIGVPISIIIYCTSHPIVGIIYGRGNYTDDAVIQSAIGLKYYSFCFIPVCIKLIYVRAFYSMLDTKRPMIITTAETIVNIICSIILAGYYGIKGIVLGTAISGGVFCVILALSFHKNKEKSIFGKEKKEYFKILIAAVGALIAVRFVPEIANLYITFIVNIVVVGSVFCLILLMLKEQMLAYAVNKFFHQV